MIASIAHRSSIVEMSRLFSGHFSGRERKERTGHTQCLLRHSYRSEQKLADDMRHVSVLSWCSKDTAQRVFEN